MTDIAKKLNENGVITPGEYIDPKRFCNKKWNGETVSRILNNECYKGVAIFNKRNRDKVGSGSVVKLDKILWIVNKDYYQALI